ncbi:MAG: hypothetical protein ACRDPP_00090 [Gaiellaceae bacterium]
MSELKELPGKEGVRSRTVERARPTRRKRGRRERPEVEIVVPDGTPEGDLAAAQSEVAAATEAWSIAAERDRALERPAAVSDSMARELGIESIYSLDSQGRRVIDPVEVELHRARTARDREAAALVLSAAREKHAAAGVTAANVKLAEATAAYEPLAQEVEHRRQVVERCYADLVTHVWSLNDALDEEKQLKARILRIAKGAAPSPEVRDRIRIDADERLPAEMTSTGPSRTIPRAGRELFGGAAARKHETWAGLVELILAGPRRGRGAAGKTILAALDAAEARRELRALASADDATAPSAPDE